MQKIDDLDNIEEKDGLGSEILESIHTDNAILQKYFDELSVDVTINPRNLREKALLVSAIRAKWLKYMMKEKENLKKLDTYKEKLKISLLEKERDVNPSINSLKNRVDNSIYNNDETMVKLMLMITDRKEIITFLEYAWNILNDFGYNVKNVIDYMKMENS